MGTYAPGPGAVQPAWTAGRVISVVTGCVLALVAVGLLGVGTVLLWAGQTQRSGGYLTTPSRALGTSGYAVTSDVLTLEPGAAGWVNGSLLGRVRIRATAAPDAQRVFIGIAPAASVRSYLAGTSYSAVTGFTGPAGVTYTQHVGFATPAAPSSRPIWTAHISGTGTQSLIWQARSGNWIIVVMNASAAPGVSVIADGGATVPGLTGIAAGFVAAGVAAGAGAVALILIPVRLAGRSRGQWQPPEAQGGGQFRAGHSENSSGGR